MVSMDSIAFPFFVLVYVGREGDITLAVKYHDVLRMEAAFCSLLPDGTARAIR